MSLKFNCPGCKKSIRVTMQHAGLKANCPACGTLLKIPSREKLQQLEAQLSSTSAISRPAPQPDPAPPAEDPLDDIPLTRWEDDDFNSDQPAAEQRGGANPFSSPLAEDTVAAPHGATSDVEATRRRLLKHEASIRSMGTLFYFGSVIWGLLAMAMIIAGLAGPPQAAADDPPAGLFLGIGVVAVALSAFQFWVARGLRKCDPRVRIPAIVLSAITLLNFPIGTMIGGYFLYLLGGQNGEQILSTEYQQVVAATPHIKHKTSIVVWILLGLLVLFLAFAIVGLIFA